MMAEEGRTLRLFFALWPGAAVRAHLAQAARAVADRCGGRCTREENLHLTLVFLGEVTTVRLGEIEAMAARIGGERFVLHLDQMGCFAKKRLAWCAPRTPPAALLRLVGALEVGLGALGFAREARPFLPHVTLARHAHCGGEPMPAIDVLWPVEDFVLVRSQRREDGAAYEVLARWPFA